VDINGLQIENINSNPESFYSFIEQKYKNTKFLATSTAAQKSKVLSVDLYFYENPEADFLYEVFESFKQMLIQNQSLYFDQNQNYHYEKFPIFTGQYSGQTCHETHVPVFKDPAILYVKPESQPEANGQSESHNFKPEVNLMLGDDGCYYPSTISY
jgi:hypothetical protein